MFTVVFFFFQAEDGIRYLVRSRGLGDVYKRQPHFDVILVNDRLEDTLDKATEIVAAFIF